MKLNKKLFLSIILFSVLLFGSLSSSSVARSSLQLDGTSVVINEIHYNPASIQGTDNEYEFAELYNNGSSAVDLTGWTFETVSLDGITIAAGGYVIIAYTSATYSGLASASCSVVGVGAYFGLSNGGNTLDLMDGVVTMDQVTYDDAAPWPTTPDDGSSGVSLEKILPGLSNIADHWGPSLDVGGSPCAQNTAVSVLKISASSHSPWTPAPGEMVTYKARAIDVANPVTNVNVTISTDGFATNSTHEMSDGDNDNIWDISLAASNTPGTVYSYSFSAGNSLGNKVTSWNAFMNFTTMADHPFISGFKAQSSGTNTGDTFITLTNPGSSSVDISGWYLSDEAKVSNFFGSIGSFDSVWQFPASSSIDAGASIFVAADGTAFESLYGMVADFEMNGTSTAPNLDKILGGSNTFDLYEGGEEIVLASPDAVIDVMMYQQWTSVSFDGDSFISIQYIEFDGNPDVYSRATSDTDDPATDFSEETFPFMMVVNSFDGATFDDSGNTLDLVMFDQDGVSKSWYNWDGGSNTTATVGATTSITTTSKVGARTLNLYANDSTGQESVLSYVFIITGDAPLILLESPANNALIKAASTVSISVVDADGVASVDYNWDGAANSSMSIEIDNTYEITSPGTDGLHTLNVFSEDINGALSDDVFTFTVDGTNPVITLNSPVNATTVIAGTVVDLDVTDTNLASVDISVNSATAITFASPYDYSLSTLGSVTLLISATDGAGNIVTLSLVYTVELEETTTTTPPVTTTAPVDDTSEEAGFLPGFTLVYTLIAFVSVFQLMKIKKSRR